MWWEVEDSFELAQEEERELKELERGAEVERKLFSKVKEKEETELEKEDRERWESYGTPMWDKGLWRRGEVEKWDLEEGFKRRGVVLHCSRKAGCGGLFAVRADDKTGECRWCRGRWVL